MKVIIINKATKNSNSPDKEAAGMVKWVYLVV